MSLQRAAALRLSIILAKWSRALRASIAEHGVPNSFGVVELAAEYGLVKRDGYRLGTERLLDLRAWLEPAQDVVLTYKRGRFHLDAIASR